MSNKKGSRHRLSFCVTVCCSTRMFFALVWVYFILSGTFTISSLRLQWSALQIRSKCSRFTLSAISWYNSPIVFGLIPVLLANSACVILCSPNRVLSKILINVIAPSLMYPNTPASICAEMLFIIKSGYNITKSDIVEAILIQIPALKVPIKFQ